MYIRPISNHMVMISHSIISFLVISSVRIVSKWL